MSGFTPQWLALREKADHAARDAELAAAVYAYFAGRDPMTILDLGCGTGSNLRAMADGLPAHQIWRLADWDPALLHAARGRLVAWADDALTDGENVLLHRGAHEISLRLEQADLAQGLNDVLSRPADLVTATAFFDLVSARWIDDLCHALATHRLPLYATLTYDGHEDWQPPHAADGKVLAAFHAHQAQDKGFGPASGPFAAAHLERVLEDHGYRVMRAASPWVLGAQDAELIGEIARGAAGAVAETGLVPGDEIVAWRGARETARACTIGHVDVFAVPG